MGVEMKKIKRIKINKEEHIGRIKQLFKNIITSANRLTFIVTAITLLLVLGSYLLFSVELNNKLESQTSRHLTGIIESKSEYTKLKIDECFKTMEALALFIGEYDSVESEEALLVLNKYISTSVFDSMSIINLEGEAKSTAGETYNVADEEYFEKAKKGKRSIADVLRKDKEGKKILKIAFVVPIIKDEEVVGVLECYETKKKMTELLDISSFGQKGNSFIVRRDGTLITTGSPKTDLKTIKEILPQTTNITNKLLNAFASRNSGYLSYVNNKYKRYICYDNLDMGDWYLITIISSTAVEPTSAEIIDQGFLLSIRIVAIFVAYLAYLFIKNVKIKASSNVNEEKYKIVAEQSDSIVFEYAYDKGVLFYSDKWKEKFGIDLSGKISVESIIDKQFVYPEDVSIFEKLVQDFQNNEKYVEVELRLLSKNDTYIWCKIKAKLLKSKKEFKIIGRIVDIDTLRQEVEYYKNMSNQDPLTNLYNKRVGNHKLEVFLSRRNASVLCALIYFDIDDFKMVNDKYGHMFGDEVLKSVSTVLKNNLDDDSFASRVGGDEFWIVIKRAHNEAIIEQVIDKVEKDLSKIKYEKYPDYKVTISAGIAISPKDGITAEEIIQKADRALYYSKETGKNKHTYA